MDGWMEVMFLEVLIEINKMKSKFS